MFIKSKNLITRTQLPKQQEENPQNIKTYILHILEECANSQIFLKLEAAVGFALKEAIELSHKNLSNDCSLISTDWLIWSQQKIGTVGLRQALEWVKNNSYYPHNTQ